MKDVCNGGNGDVTKPRAALGLAADNGAANADFLLLLADRIIIVIRGLGKTIKRAPESIESEKRVIEEKLFGRDVCRIVEQFEAARPAQL